MAHVPSRKLSNAFEGALAGGGDPATSPLYVFGPFLKLIVVAGVAQVTFGASIWLVVLTVAVVSAMYRLVMHWVTDGSGGSGLTEEEFGSWAVKINAGITFVEYTLTFLVSIAALVTFIADRFFVLNEPLLLGLPGRVFVAIGLSVLTGWLVNQGPKVAARTFGPATLAVLLLLWAMNIATIWKLGLELPSLNLQAFVPPYLNYTLAGYARILALMTGIEVFANLVAAYEGSPEEKARKAFGSLLIIMGTTTATMLITGPAIFKVADPLDEKVSVFTQTMDYLLPDPLPYVGTLVGVVVLLSAAAASAQGIQNLALGMKDRHYIPPVLGQRNKYDVADKPVWLQVGLASLAFLLLGTREETYLSIYAAGVFILLSMTAWATAKRLWRHVRESYDLAHGLTLVGTLLAAFLTSLATVIIFYERFTEGAWMYFVFIPALYGFFTYFRSKLGPPSPLKERLGEIEGAMWSLGMVPAHAEESQAPTPSLASSSQAEISPASTPTTISPATIRHILVPLDGSEEHVERCPSLLTWRARTGLRSRCFRSSRNAGSWGCVCPLLSTGVPAKNGELTLKRPLKIWAVTAGRRLPCTSRKGRWSLPSWPKRSVFASTCLSSVRTAVGGCPAGSSAPPQGPYFTIATVLCSLFRPVRPIRYDGRVSRGCSCPWMGPHGQNRYCLTCTA